MRRRWCSTRRARRAGAVLVGVLALLVASCDPRRPADPDGGTGSAIWPATPPPWSELVTPEARRALDAAGVTRQLVEAGELTDGGSLERRPPAPILDGLPALLVVRGDWETLSSADDERLAEELLLLAVEWEGGGTVVRGIHLFPGGELDDADAAAETLAALARRLPRRLRLSLHLEPQWLTAEEEDLIALTRSVDLVTASVYGQPWQDVDVPALWDLDGALQRARQADALGRPFLAALSLEGRLFDASSGAVLARGLPPQQMAPGVHQLAGAFSYQGYHRQLLDVTVGRRSEAPGRTGETVRLEPGTVARLARPTVPHLARLTSALRDEGLQGLGGFVWRIAGDPPHAAAVPVSRLPAVLSADEPQPPIAFELERGSSRLRVTLRNGPDPSAWADREYNYVEVDLDGAVFGEVDPGGFARIALAPRADADRLSPLERVRRADRLRLFFVAVEPGQEVVSGAIAVRARRGGWSASARVVVLGPAGDVVTVPESADRSP